MGLILYLNPGAYGVDDPHVRFTIHIKDPVSLTEFTQGSGHAGCNGEHALSLVILPFEFNKPLGTSEDYEGKVSMRQMVLSRPPPICQCAPQALFLDGHSTTCIELGAAKCDLCQHKSGIIEDGSWIELIKSQGM